MKHKVACIKDGRYRPNAFTLIELLIVSAIIAILATLVVGSAHRVRVAANSAACLSNLRQIYMISQTFAEDHDGYTPQAWWFGPSTGGPARPAGIGANLSDYGFNGQELACPIYSKVAPDLTYGINLNLVAGPPGAWGSRNIYFSLHGRYKFFAFPKPAATAFYFDTPLMDGRTYARYTAPSASFVDFRHNSKANTVFLDGHVKALTPEALSDALSVDLMPN